MIDYQELKMLAEAASHGPWKYWGEAGHEIFGSPAGQGMTRIFKLGLDTQRADAEFIAAANPATVLALIAATEAFAYLLKRFVDSEYEQDEDQGERHSYHGDAELLLTKFSGEFKEYTLVSSDALHAEYVRRKEIRAEREKLKAEVERLTEMVRKEENQADAQRDYQETMLEYSQGEREKLLAEVETLRESANFKAVQSLRADCEDLRKDAERYRHIRENSYVEVRCQSPRKNGWSPELLDFCVDDAMTKEPK